MGVQRYDIPDAAGSFRMETWSPVNPPLVDGDGRIVGVLHHVEDITAVHDVLHEAGADVLGGPRQPANVVRHALVAASRCTGSAMSTCSQR